MADKAWKAWERTVADKLGGTRRGPDTRGADGGKTDVIHDHFAVECKLLGAPTYGAIVEACRQAEANADPGQEPIAVVKRKSARADDAIVAMRLKTFLDWRGDG